jgi:hypothetical protein
MKYNSSRKKTADAFENKITQVTGKLKSETDDFEVLFTEPLRITKIYSYFSEQKY